ncbi:hypothetical protein ACFLX8_04025 [Chloroflexota bacterium]
MAPLQKRALYSLGIGVVLAIALIMVFILKGDVTTFDEDLGFRLIVYALWVGVPLASLIVVNLTLRKPEQVDEQDRLIMGRAPKVQLLAVIFSLVAWVIVLTELYWEQGEGTSNLPNLNNDIHAYCQYDCSVRRHPDWLLENEVIC